MIIKLVNIIEKNKIFQILVFWIIALLSVADLISSEIYEGIENPVDKGKTEEFESLIRAGDSIFWYTADLRSVQVLKAMVYYKQALEIDSTNQEVLFRIAYFYDMLDSVHIAKQYYQKLNTKYLKIYDRSREIIYPEINVKNVINNFNNENSFVEKFRKFGKKSSITLDYYYSNDHRWLLYPNWFEYIVNGIFYKKIFFTVYGNGEFESRTYDFKKDSKKYICGKLPDSILIIILKTIESGRLLSLKKLFVEEDSEINLFYDIHDIIPPADILFYPTYFERFTIESPEFYHSIKGLNLVDRSLDRIYSSRNELDINLNYNNTLEDKVESKLRLIDALWKYIFCLDLTKFSTD